MFNPFRKHKKSSGLDSAGQDTQSFQSTSNNTGQIPYLNDNLAYNAPSSDIRYYNQATIPINGQDAKPIQNFNIPSQLQIPQRNNQFQENLYQNQIDPFANDSTLPQNIAPTPQDISNDYVQPAQKQFISDTKPAPAQNLNNLLSPQNANDFSTNILDSQPAVPLIKITPLPQSRPNILSSFVNVNPASQFQGPNQDTAAASNSTGSSNLGTQPKVQIQVRSAQDNQTKPALDLTDNQSLEFLDTLVGAMLGYKIVDLSEDRREKIVTECVDIFSEYIIEYVQQKFGQKDAVRLKAGQQFSGLDVFAKFPDLGERFDEAYDSFVLTLKNNLVS